jgi:uncharacterized protein YeaO (DUF488 family)
MAIQQAIWRLGETPVRLGTAKLGSEKLLEDIIVSDPEILSPYWMLIGRQVQTDFRGYIDLLALQPDGTPVVIELKKDKTPRDVLGQALDYASWVEDLTPNRMQMIYERFTGDPNANLNADFAKRFGTELQDEALVRDHLIVIVAAELDNSTERIVRFLAKRNVNINVLFFQVFEDSAGQLLSRAWLVDPASVQVGASSSGDVNGVWNGEYYVSFGEDESQRWEDAVKFGFITASGGAWYTQTLSMLSEGDRVWVNMPKQGYVGVGTVTGNAVPASEFYVDSGKEQRLLIEVDGMSRYAERIGTDEQAWFVPIKWDHTLKANEAIREVGFFGNQNTVAKPKSEKWDYTVSVLKNRFEQ